MSELTHTVEALLFVASEPLSVAEIATLAEAPPARVERALDALRDHYCEERSGVVLERVAGGYGFRASRETAAACARLVNRPNSRALSQAALETLAIVAYLGPVARPEVARIRGVAADSAVAGLLERGLIEESGRGETPGQPVLYKTTVLFERLFGLEEGLGSLPSLGEFDLPEADHEAEPGVDLGRVGAVLEGEPLHELDLVRRVGRELVDGDDGVQTEVLDDPDVPGEVGRAALDLRHSINLRNGNWLRLKLDVKLIAQQMLDVVNQQLLVLHFMFEAESY
jgi:segregation and condensation protein B